MVPVILLTILILIFLGSIIYDSNTIRNWLLLRRIQRKAAKLAKFMDDKKINLVAHGLSFPDPVTTRVRINMSGFISTEDQSAKEATEDRLGISIEKYKAMLCEIKNSDPDVIPPKLKSRYELIRGA